MVSDDMPEFRTTEAVSFLDRCGNNWKNGKGGCGLLCTEELSLCLATMFQPLLLIKKHKNPVERNPRKC